MGHIKLIFVLATVLCTFTGLNGEKCPCPEKPEKDLTLVSSNELELQYKKGEIVVWECKKGKGYGTVWLECKGNGDWTKPNKKCNEQIPFNIASLFGVLCGVFTIIIEIVFVFLSTKLMRKKAADEDVELRIMEASKTGTTEA